VYWAGEEVAGVALEPVVSSEGLLAWRLLCFGLKVTYAPFVVVVFVALVAFLVVVVVDELFVALVVAAVKLCAVVFLEAQMALVEAFVDLLVPPKRTEKCQAFHCCFCDLQSVGALKARQNNYFDWFDLNGGFDLNGWRRFWTGWTRSKFPDLSWTVA
jgi:hypothetical protein